MKKKTKIIATSLMAIAMSTSLVAGGTYALFTSESKVNISVTSGTVKITATAENIDLYSPTSIGMDGAIVDATDASTETTFANGGTATIADGNVVKLERMTAGDKVSFDIVVTNDSNVTVQYQTKIEMLEGIDLFSGLKITLEKGEDSTEYDGMTALSEWATLTETGEVERTTVTIELPADAGNEYQGLSCKLAFTVNAVQGNSAIANPEATTTYIYNASDLVLFARSVNNGNSYLGKTVKLMNNVDLAGIEWTPIGQTGATTFAGIFDGQDYTISNMTVNNTDTSANCASGLFGWIEDHGEGIKVKNVKFNNASVTGNHNVGVVVGYIYGTIENCEVKNSTVIANNANDDANGDKVGGIVGMVGEDAFINNNKIINCTIKGNRDIGGIAGAINTGIDSFTGNAVSDTTITYETERTYASAGEIVSGRTGFVPDDTNTATNVTVTQLN